MAFTKVVGPGIHTLANITSHNVHSSGIITATRFDGPFTNLNVTGVVTFAGEMFMWLRFRAHRLEKCCCG